LILRAIAVESAGLKKGTLDERSSFWYVLLHYEVNEKIMGAQSFDNLKISDKILLIEDMGELVFSLEFYEHRIYLFSFNTLFIEAYKNLETDEFEKIHSITLADLDKFLSQVTLGNLVKKEKSIL
jgi:hypothetical protein